LTLPLDLVADGDALAREFDQIVAFKAVQQPRDDFAHRAQLVCQRLVGGGQLLAVAQDLFKEVSWCGFVLCITRTIDQDQQLAGTKMVLLKV
jgi:hypothetical protein